MMGWDDAIGAVLSGVASGIGASKQKKALENFKLAKPNYKGVGDAQTEFSSQIYNLKDVAGLLGKGADLDNAEIQKDILAADPNATANTKSVSQLAADRAMGGLAPDTVDAIKRANAYASLQGGFAGSSMSDNAVDLKTAQARMKMMASAPGLNKQAFGMSQEFSPVNPDVGSTLIGPSDIMKRNDQFSDYNQDIINQGRIAQLNSDMQPGGGSTGTMLSSLGGGIAGLMKPSGSSGWGSPEWQNQSMKDEIASGVYSSGWG